MIATCPHCGGEFERAARGPGRLRKWCSGRCRRAACEEVKRAACPLCGEPMHMGSAWHPSDRCVACELKARHDGHAERVELLARLYNEGKSVKEIQHALGYGENSTAGALFGEARRLGLIGYRNRGYGNVA